MKLLDNIIKKPSTINCILFLIISSTFVIMLFPNLFQNVVADELVTKTSLTNGELQTIFVNLERIKTQLNLVNNGLINSEIEGSFYHSYIPHTTTFPAIKEISSKINSSSSKEIESLLTDLPITIKSINSNNNLSSLSDLGSKLNHIQNRIENMENLAINQSETPDKNLLYFQTSLLLLKDALQSYNISNVENDASVLKVNKIGKVDYENALGLINSSETLFNKIQFDSQAIKPEVKSLYAQLEKEVKDKKALQDLTKIYYSMERTYSKGLSLSNNGTGNLDNTNIAQYFANIDGLLSKVGNSVSNGDYKQADRYAISAYLDNYEFLEAPIEKINSTLMSELEIAMRENLRSMISEQKPSQEIISFIDNSIIQKLDRIEPSLRQLPENISISTTANIPKTLANIETLQKGFGIYTGERKDIGQANDLQKQGVRNNIDQIRLKLNEMLKLYKEGEYNDALSVSRSAYLDSYENIEIPLRPINPDFTLDMEIKFAELRNLLQEQKPFAIVEKKVIEIRNGLDESERLVSGTGVIAPSIAFSSSFSIIFREGLESALIIGAILTYLEASRNDRYKKQVYYGIIIAVVATAITWVIATHIIQISGINRELIEAVAGLSAVAVLFWVSFWVLNKIETKRWIEFVKAKVWKASATGSVLVFVMLSFFTVYREGFETVLFYQAMFSFAKYMELYVTLGLVIGIVVITSVALIIKKLGKRLPLRVLFGLTMGIGAYMSIAFIGNAIRDFQEVGYISTSPLFGIIPRLDINLASMTGIHPTLESTMGQLILLAIYVAGSLYVLVIQPRKKKKIELSRKSIGERYGKKV